MAGEELEFGVETKVPGERFDIGTELNVAGEELEIRVVIKGTVTGKDITCITTTPFILITRSLSRHTMYTNLCTEDVAFTFLCL